MITQEKNDGELQRCTRFIARPNVVTSSLSPSLLFLSLHLLKIQVFILFSIVEMLRGNPKTGFTGVTLKRSITFLWGLTFFPKIDDLRAHSTSVVSL